MIGTNEDSVDISMMKYNAHMRLEKILHSLDTVTAKSQIKYIVKPDEFDKTNDYEFSFKKFDKFLDKNTKKQIKYFL